MKYLSCILAAACVIGCAREASLVTRHVLVPVRVGPVKRIGGSTADPVGQTHREFAAQVSSNMTVLYIGAGGPGGGGAAMAASGKASAADHFDAVLLGAADGCSPGWAVDVKELNVGSAGTFAPLIVHGKNYIGVQGSIREMTEPSPGRQSDATQTLQPEQPQAEEETQQ